MLFAQLTVTDMHAGIQFLCILLEEQTGRGEHCYISLTESSPDNTADAIGSAI